MHALSSFAQRIAAPFLRISFGVILLWIGALKFVNPGAVTKLLEASFPFLAFESVVYVIGVIEIVAALLLFAGIGIRYVALFLVGEFAVTLIIFLIAPSLTFAKSGFPVLTLTGEFLLKDLVLMAAATTLLALETSDKPLRTPNEAAGPAPERTTV